MSFLQFLLQSLFVVYGWYELTMIVYMVPIDSSSKGSIEVVGIVVTKRIIVAS